MEDKSFIPEGHFAIEVWRDGKLHDTIEIDNAVVNVGATNILDVMFNEGAQATSWHIGLINNQDFSSINVADTMASHSGWAETSAYDEATRPEWTAGSASNRSITNAATVDFTINATVTIRGIFITSDDTKGGTTGTLWSAAALGSTVALQDDDVLKITYTLSC